MIQKSTAHACSGSEVLPRHRFYRYKNWVLKKLTDLVTLDNDSEPVDEWEISKRQGGHDGI